MPVGIYQRFLPASYGSGDIHTLLFSEQYIKNRFNMNYLLLFKLRINVIQKKFILLGMVIEVK